MKEPEIRIQKEYLDLCRRKCGKIELGGGKRPVRIGWQLPFTMDEVTKYTLEVQLQKPGNDAERMLYAKKKHKLAAKAAACIILNGFFKIRLFHWFFWRWLYYVREYNDFQYSMIIIEGQKKSPVEAFLTGMQFLTLGKTTMMMETKKEVKQSQVVPVTG